MKKEISKILKKNFYKIYHYLRKLYDYLNISSSISFYIVIGIATNLASLLFFIIQFEYLKFSSLQAQFFSTLIATFLNYILNSQLTFKDNRIFVLKKAIRYLLGLAITFIFMRLCFLFFYNVFNLSTLSYLLSIVITSIFFFFWQKIYVFKK